MAIGLALIDTSENPSRSLLRQLRELLHEKNDRTSSNMVDLSLEIIDRSTNKTFAESASVLIQACAYFFEVGLSTSGVMIGKKLASRAAQLQDILVHRRVCNMVGGQYCDLADFASAMEYLETAIVLARKIGDPTVEATCLANVIAVLQEMGHYRQAIALADRVLKLNDESVLARKLKLQSASNGLFAAHRSNDAIAAARFLRHGEINLRADTEPLRRAFFEKGRASYLVDLGDAHKARGHLNETTSALRGIENTRINILLSISESVCEWGVGAKDRSRAQLEGLYEETKRSRLYHHFVLQALVKVYSDSETPMQASKGLLFARELVEYTTSVKKAKFYRQLANRREEIEPRASCVISTVGIDPFSSIKAWLSNSDILIPLADEPPSARRELTKHEELTAIHEDMAKLRVATLRRDIRTDAVDTAENWAIAAEFFDDETGQHCYRVGHLASLLAREIGMDETFCIQVEHAARLHDIGKIAVNEVILLKPGPLDASEMAAMRLHTEVGAQILSGSDDPTLMMAAEVARHHHEWWNGSGYPMKLTAKHIPMSARICAYADVYDALTHARSYKKAWTHERALDEILRLANTQFDPELAKPFCTVLDRYRVDLATKAIPGFADMDTNALIASRKKLMETIAADGQ